MTAPLTAFRLAARSLLAARGFTTTAVLTLGLGMTLCTTAMVVVGAYLLNDLPYPAADRLHWIRYGAPGQDQPRDMEKLDWASLNDVIEHPVAWDLDVFYMLGDHVESVPGAWVTSGFVQGLGIQPAIGRGFDAERVRARLAERRPHQPSPVELALRQRPEHRRPDLHRLCQRPSGGGRAVHGHRRDAGALLAHQPLHRRPDAAARADLSVHGAAPRRRHAD